VQRTTTRRPEPTGGGRRASLPVRRNQKLSRSLGGRVGAKGWGISTCSQPKDSRLLEKRKPKEAMRTSGRKSGKNRRRREKEVKSTKLIGTPVKETEGGRFTGARAIGKKGTGPLKETEKKKNGGNIKGKGRGEDASRVLSAFYRTKHGERGKTHGHVPSVSEGFHEIC